MSVTVSIWGMEEKKNGSVCYHLLLFAIVENNLIIFVLNIKWECQRDMCHPISVRQHLKVGPDAINTL